MKLLLIDNYDSFTFNLLHYLRIGGADVTVVRNDALSVDELNLKNYDGAVLSPGPCTPQDTANLMDFVRIHAGRKPLLGVCLGMQAIGVHFGWELKKAKVPRHGKPSLLNHYGRGIFENLQNQMQIGRYHSLIIVPQNSDNQSLCIEAECESEIMAVSGFGDLVWGLQFHPESILTPLGQQLINQWLQRAFVHL